MVNTKKLKLTQNLIDKLSSLPENGMGYQIVDIKLNNGQILENRIVFNCTFLKLEENENLENENIKDINLMNNTVKFEINMINVEDGDAIILQLIKPDKKALILIDGGYRSHYPKLKKRLDELLPKYDNKIDLIVCTHYDNDHLEGISLLLDDCFKSGSNIKIENIWLHKIENTLTELINSMEKRLSNFEQNELLEKNRNLINSRLQIDLLHDNSIIESYTFLKSMLQKMYDYGLENKIKEVKRGDYLEGFEEFSVVSPSVDYYNDYLIKLKKEKILVDVKNSVSNKFLNESKKELTWEEEVENKFLPCEKLKVSSVANQVTPTNMVSIVTTLQTKDHKLLFTADSGIESYQLQGLLDDSLKDLDWLQLPHHGSKNNTSKFMLNHFNPKITFVSGNGNENRPDSKIVNCLREKSRFQEIHITNKESNTWYLKIDERLIPERVQQ